MKQFEYAAIPTDNMDACAVEPLELTPGDVQASIERLIGRAQDDPGWTPRVYHFFVPETLLLHRPKPKFYRFWFKSSRLKWMKRRNWLAESLRNMGAVPNQRLKDAP